MTTKQLATDPRVGRGCDDLHEPPRLTQAARDGAMEAWLDVLSQRHPEVVWVPKKRVDLETAGS